MKMPRATTKPKLRLVLDGDHNDCDGPPVQRTMRLLTVARADPVAPIGPIELVPVHGGQYLMVGDVSPERRRDLQALALAVSKSTPVNVSTCDTPEKVVVSARELLRLFARRPGVGALNVAGQLFVEHGADARRVLARDWRTGWPAFEKLDAHLERAGLPACDTLPGIA